MSTKQAEDVYSMTDYDEFPGGTSQLHSVRPETQLIGH